MDSRFLHQKVFIQKFIKNDPLVTLAHKCYRIIPGLLKSMKNMQDPWPNVDALSGVILNYYGVYESEFYIVFNALARSIGCMANLVIARSLSKIDVLFIIYNYNLFQISKLKDLIQLIWNGLI